MFKDSGSSQLSPGHKHARISPILSLILFLFLVGLLVLNNIDMLTLVTFGIEFWMLSVSLWKDLKPLRHRLPLIFRKDTPAG